MCVCVCVCVCDESISVGVGVGEKWTGNAGTQKGVLNTTVLYIYRPIIKLSLKTGIGGSEIRQACIVERRFSVQ